MAKKAAKRAPRPAALERLDLVERFERSDTPILEFAKAAKIKSARIYQWRSQLGLTGKRGGEKNLDTIAAHRLREKIAATPKKLTIAGVDPAEIFNGKQVERLASSIKSSAENAMPTPTTDEPMIGRWQVRNPVSEARTMLQAAEALITQRGELDPADPVHKLAILALRALESVPPARS